VGKRARSKNIQKSPRKPKSREESGAKERKDEVRIRSNTASKNNLMIIRNKNTQRRIPLSLRKGCEVNACPHIGQCLKSCAFSARSLIHPDM
jgi:hypothetical protein